MNNRIKDDALENVSGGMDNLQATNNKANHGQLMSIECPFCHFIFNADVMQKYVICPTDIGGCGEKIEFSG
ncbi:MAG: hypothetical protein K6G22_02140 [Lachnospiraceae bacterium]|nr:hypothetical protein [Lachnospiraceae bacterium]